jgi:signal transduction histidine kinase
MAGQPQQATARTTTALVAATVLVSVAGAALTLWAWRDLAAEDAYPNLVTSFSAVLYAVLGWIIVRRVHNRIGWILLATGLLLAVMGATSAYSVVGVLTSPGSLPAGKIVGALSELAFVPISMGVAYVLLLFPTGRLPSPRWRMAAAASAALAVVVGAAYIVTPRTVALPAPGGVSLLFANPLGLGLVGDLLGPVGTIVGLTVVYLVALGLALVALVGRYRSGSRDQRQQIKWLAFTALAGLAFQLVASLGTLMSGSGPSPAIFAVYLAEAAVALIGVPVAITVAILRYGLYEIDVIINRTVVYGLLAAAVTAVYVGVVVGIGTLLGYGVDSPLLTTVAAVAIALLFQPLRRQAQRAANRLVYGERATPYQVLSDFAGDMAGTLGLDDILDRMVSVLADGTGATRVDAWIRIGSQLCPAAAWPRGSAPAEPLAVGPGDELIALPDATRTIAVRQGAELLGALALHKPRSESLSMTEDKLLQHLASQAGLVLRNVRLTAELRATIGELTASRRRLVEAQDLERRKIERNLHDGAQQQLVALRVQLGLLEALAEDSDRVRAMAAQLRDALQQALDDLRDLARGIYPPLLAERGLAVALEGPARRLAAETAVQSDGLGRYSEDVEAAVYFCALEALQNVGKYAAATSTVVRLAEADGHLTFEVEDDGCGFRPSETRFGTGLQGMADRLDALGGDLEVTSEPGRGTLVRGRLRLASASHSAVPAPTGSTASSRQR